METTGIPFLPMSMAKGLLPDSHPQSVAAARSLAIARADVVMLVGARLNWLLSHGDSPQWSADAKFVQIDIAASEFDSNQPIAAPLAGDIGSVMSALLDGVAAHPIAAPTEWTGELAERKARNDAKMRERLAEDPHPMRFYNALRRHSRCAATESGGLCGQRGRQRAWTWPATSSTWSCRDTGSTPEPGG